ncbi:hypothetical protein K2173_003904 [Erythroxylum novogranatense]|uniref:Uncharacterized protein n=1 Tax=Erythroxylum novogranatense TaxID=1862640 RepID=A0AAV8SJY5_9ROSI|nr:hypothetical protein K2173_003904 [Erythroxylum novogranatense]
MNNSEDWKSLFPIGSVFGAPFLLSGPSLNAILGPLLFNPCPQSLSQLFNSSSLSPLLLNPPPHFSLSRFLSSSDFPVPTSVSFSVDSLLGPQQLNDAASMFYHNRLQLLQYPNGNSVIVFFPTGSNNEQVGFLVVSVKDKNLVAMRDHDGGIFTARKSLSERIVRILVNPTEDLGCIGYLLVYTLYSVHWFCVKVSGVDEVPVLGYMGCKSFKSCSILSACWSHHIPEESLVLTENGGLYLFDLESESYNTYYTGTKLKVSWGGYANSSNCKWLGCEFSWHPRIFVVARSDMVFLVDCRFDECNLTCLANIDMFGVAISDQFHFVLASDNMLVVCDVRKPLMPILQWQHGLDKPCYVHVFRLSELRANSRYNKNEWATETGFGIILGSFWNCEFGLFCYGPSLPTPEGSMASEISKFSKSFYAWELPSDLLLSGHKCRCGACLVREEFSKDYLPIWIDWQQKKDLVLGFGILSSDLSSLIFEPDEFGGFTLIRLMSSGKLELQSYVASWDLVKKFEASHSDLTLSLEDNFLLSVGFEDSKFPRKFKYVELAYLVAYMNGNLFQLLNSNMTRPSKGSWKKDYFGVDSHKVLCEKLRIFNFSPSRAPPAIDVVFNDINLPASIHEVVLRRLWTGLPVELLQLAFSSYSEFLEVLLDKKKLPLEFLVVPDQPQLPPFFIRKPSSCSTKWSRKVQPSDNLVGPVLPVPILFILHEFRKGHSNSKEQMDLFSFEEELTARRNEVLKVARELNILDFLSEQNASNAVSLADERDNLWADSGKPNSFVSYHPHGGDCSVEDPKEDIYDQNNHSSALMISKLHKEVRTCGDKMESIEEELFHNLCPIDLNFGVTGMNLRSQELTHYNLLKMDLSKWGEKCNPYQACYSQAPSI